jgi:predicted alpha/beta-fold hydrolase
MPDHGDSIALNQQVFHGGRLAEVVQAVYQISYLAPALPLTLIGISMGGNFALRVAWQHSTDHPIPTLTRIIALCPSVSPREAVQALDAHPVYRSYFQNKWAENLEAKAQAFPDYYDFSRIIAGKTCAARTEMFLAEYSHFASADDYYRVYAFGPDKLASVTIPTTILAAADDPLIPIKTITALDGLNGRRLA